MDYIPVDTHSNLVRCTKSGAILNINTNEIENARNRKALKKLQEKRIDNIENDINLIKSMLAQIVEKLDG